MNLKKVLLTSFTGLLLITASNFAQITNWNEIMSRQGSSGNQYGYAVSVSGNYAIVGEYKSASAYVLYKDQGGTDNWGQVKMLAPTGAGSAFGFSVSISGDNIVVGDIGAGMSYTGAAFIFNRNQ